MRMRQNPNQVVLLPKTDQTTTVRRSYSTPVAGVLQRFLILRMVISVALGFTSNQPIQSSRYQAVLEMNTFNECLSFLSCVAPIDRR